MLTDRMRVEMALPARIMYSVFTSGAEKDYLETPPGKELQALFARAAVEPFEGMEQKKKYSVIRRTERLFEEVVKPYDGMIGTKVGLVFFYMIKELIDRDILILYEGSAMGEAMMRFMPAIEEAFDITALDQSAQKQARKVLDRLKAEGYYGWT